LAKNQKLICLGLAEEPIELRKGFIGVAVGCIVYLNLRYQGIREAKPVGIRLQCKTLGPKEKR